MTNKYSKIFLKKMKGDLKLLKKDPLEYCDAVPNESNLFEWNFLLKGPEETPYEGGWYIGLIIYPDDYPMSAPNVKMLTPSGRFIINQKICISNTGYHANEWSPGWNIQSVIHGFLSIMVDSTEHGISHISRPDAVRIEHAKKSVEYNKKNHKNIITKFTRFFDENGDLIKQTKGTEDKKTDNIVKEEIVDEDNDD